jgi:hypothetical protein
MRAPRAIFGKETAMGTVKTVDFERSGLGKGIKAAALVLILAAAALTTDHVVFTRGTQPAAAPMAAQAAVPLPAAIDGFALPDNLRPTQADVVENAPTF